MKFSDKDKINEGKLKRFSKEMDKKLDSKDYKEHYGLEDVKEAGFKPNMKLVKTVSEAVLILVALLIFWAILSRKIDIVAFLYNLMGIEH